MPTQLLFFTRIGITVLLKDSEYSLAIEPTPLPNLFAPCSAIACDVFNSLLKNIAEPLVGFLKLKLETNNE